MFDRVKNGISTLENNQKADLSADRLLDLLGCVMDDAVAQKNLGEASELTVEHPSFFLKKLYSVLSALSGLYEVNSTMVPQVGGMIGDRFPALEKEIQEAITSLEEVSQKIEEFEKKNKEQERQRDALESKGRQLLELEAENKELEKRIAFLRDPVLDGIAEEHRILQEELRTRTARKQALEDEKSGLESQIQELDQAVPVLQRTLDEFRRRCQEQGRIKQEKESEIADLKTRIAEFEAWKSALAENNQKLLGERDRMDAALKTFMNIWSAEGRMQVSQTALKDFKDLDRWFEEKGTAMHRGLSEYQDKLREMIQESEKLTKE